MKSQLICINKMIDYRVLILFRKSLIGIRFSYNVVCVEYQYGKRLNYS